MKKRNPTNWIKMNLKSTSNYLDYHEVDIPKTVLGVIAILLLLWGLFGCSAQRKVDKATQVVLTNEEARNKVFKVGLELNPCSADTAWKIIKGGVDSIPYPVIVSNPALRDYLIDSLAIDLSEAWNENVDSLSAQCSRDIKKATKKGWNEGYAEAQKEIAKLKLGVHRPDTLQGTITTHALENVLKDQLTAKEIEVATLNGQVIEKDKRVKEQKKTIRYAIGLDILLILLLIGTNGYWVYRSIKKKPAKLLGV